WLTASVRISGALVSIVACTECLNVSTSVAPSTSLTTASRTTAAARLLLSPMVDMTAGHTRRTAAASSVPGAWVVVAARGTGSGCTSVAGSGGAVCTGGAVLSGG